MASTSHGLSLLLFLGLILGSTWSIEQTDINYIARYLNVTYKVIDNLASPRGFSFKVALTNTGPSKIQEGQTGWSIYFNHIRLISPDGLLENDGTYTSRNGTLLDGGLRLYHVNGVLFRITPTDSFKGIDAGNSLVLDLFAKDWEVARSDIMPNWYIVGDEKSKTTPVIISSTAGESLHFVEDFVTKEQSTRSTRDQYRPYTLEQRYDMFKEVRDLGKAPLRILPSVIQSNLKADESIDLGAGGWVVSYEGHISLEKKAEYLAEKLGIPSTVDKPTTRYIHLAIDTAAGSIDNCTNNDETYTLDINAGKENVAITGREEVGVFWGIQTLLSLAKHDEGRVPSGSIVDCPRFGYRGMHADVARNFFPKETMLQLLDVMSMYKLNKFHFHLTDDEGWRLAIPGLPELTEVGAHRCHDPSGDQCIMPQLGGTPIPGLPGSGFYSVEEYKEILTYASERHIEVIPEFDMPGHSHAAINAMKARYRKYKDSDMAKAEEFLLVDLNDTSKYLSIQTFIDNAMDPCMNSTYDFIRHVVTEIKKMHADIQPLKIFNYGGDEVPKTAWVNSTACSSNDLDVDKAGFKKWFSVKVSEIAAENGLALAAWEDGFMDKAEHVPFNLTDLATDTVYTYAWNNVWEWGSGSRAYRMANLGYKAVISHATNFYFDHPNEPDPEERGYYWATRWANTRKTFGFAPDTIYDNMDVDLMGSEINREEVCSKYGCPALEKRENVLGIQGQLWSETVRTSRQFQEMVYPRILGLAERAWHKAAWEYEDGPKAQEPGKAKDWEEFSNLLGYKELKRLDEMDIHYHILPPGVRVKENVISLAVEFPGLKGQLSRDKGKTWCELTGNGTVDYDITLTVAAKSADNRRTSRFATIKVGEAPISSSPVWSYSMYVLTTSILIHVLCL